MGDSTQVFLRSLCEDSVGGIPPRYLVRTTVLLGTNYGEGLFCSFNDASWVHSGMWAL